MSIKDAAILLAESGTPVFPCREKSYGSLNAKSPYVKGGFHSASTDVAQVTQWWKEFPKAAIGMPTGSMTGISVIDLDIDVPRGKNGINDWKALCESNHYEPFQAKIIQTPRGGNHLCYKYNNVVKTSSRTLSDAIDTRSDGGYIIVPPSTIETGQYTLIHDAPMIELPDFVLAKFVTKKETPPMNIRPETLREALKFVPPDCSYDDWIKIGMALHSWDSMQGLALWDLWSRPARTYKAGLCSVKWTSFNAGNGISIGTLIEIATMYGYTPIKTPEERARQTAENGRNHRALDYLEIARKIILLKYIDKESGLISLKSWNRSYFLYSKGIYKKIPDCDFEADMTTALHEVGEDVSIYKFQNVVKNMLSNDIIHINTTNVPPCWVGKDKVNDDTWISFANGCFNLSKYINGTPEPLRKHTPNFFSMTQFEYDYNSEAKCPEWINSMNYYFERDKSAIEVVQMLFGYCLTPNRSFNIIAILFGEGGTAKSTVLDVLAGIVGKHNTSYLNMNEVTDKFARIALTTKLLNITSETETSGDLRINEPVIKTMTDGSSIYCQEKFKQGFDAKVTAQMVIASNTLPFFSDKTNGMWRRLLIIEFKKVIAGTGKSINNYAEYIIQKEGAGILNWALEGLQKLKQYTKFPTTQDMEDLVAGHRLACDKERDFALLYLSEEYGATCLLDDVYDRYAEIINGSGSHPVNRSKLALSIRSSFPKVTISEKKQWNSKRNQYSKIMQGLRIKSAMEHEL